MMALLNLDATLVTSNKCENCINKVYDLSSLSEEELKTRLTNFYNAYPMPAFNLNFTGLLVEDILCIDEIDASKTCTPDKKIEDQY
jgi:hypothetical protein